MSMTIQTTFTTNMSHEIRTPLNIILGYADLALDDPQLPPDSEIRHYLDGIATSARGLYHLLESMLQYAELDRGEVPLWITSFPVDLLLEDLRDMCRDACTNPAVRVAIADASDLALTTDRPRLRATLRALLLNAVKFTARGTVELTVTQLESEVCFQVRDTGIGIPAAQLDDIFEPFRQIDGSPTDPYGGVGLGLAIVRRNVQLLQGCVEVESQVGVGSTFAVYIPRSLEPRHP